MIEHKTCNCEDEFWEVTTVQNDPHYYNKDVIYHYCSNCDIDYCVEDFYTNEKLKMDEFSVAYNFSKN